jgi:hypothetical protein
MKTIVLIALQVLAFVFLVMQLREVDVAHYSVLIRSADFHLLAFLVLLSATNLLLLASRYKILNALAGGEIDVAASVKVISHAGIVNILPIPAGLVIQGVDVSRRASLKGFARASGSMFGLWSAHTLALTILVYVFGFALIPSLVALAGFSIILIGYMLKNGEHRRRIQLANAIQLLIIVVTLARFSVLSSMFQIDVPIDTFLLIMLGSIALSMVGGLSSLGITEALAYGIFSINQLPAQGAVLIVLANRLLMLAWFVFSQVFLELYGRSAQRRAND